MERYPCSWFRRVNIVKMAIEPKVTYRFHAISIKILMISSIVLEWINLQFIWNQKRHRIAKAILRRKNKAGDIILPGFTLYNKATVIKTMILAQKQAYRSMEQNWEPKIHPHTYGQVIYNKGGKNIPWKKDSLFSIRKAACKSKK